MSADNVGIPEKRADMSSDKMTVINGGLYGAMYRQTDRQTDGQTDRQLGEMLKSCIGSSGPLVGLDTMA